MTMGPAPKHPPCRLSAETAQPPRLEFLTKFRAALSILLEAYEYARQLQRSAWDFAVEIDCLRAAGLTNSDLRWLACQELVEHGAELTRASQDARVFHPTGPLTFTKRTCFVLTQTGAALAREGHAGAAPARDELDLRIATAVPPLVPQWDKQRQELRLGKLLVKHFKVPAPNQEMILAAFQEESWPPRIDDPLPPHPDQDPKRRLHDTINTLNRHQKHRLVHFLGDGTGEGVRWELRFAQLDIDESLHGTQ
jgi:hypothetical protein